MSSGRWYCLEVTVHEATRKGCRALSAVLWKSAIIVNLMEDNLDITEAVLLNNTMAILYIGWHSTVKGLTEEEVQACVDQFSPYIEWKGMVVKWEFQALTLAECREMIRAHEAWSQKTLRGWGRPKVTKLPAPLTERMPMRIDSSPQHFEKGARSEKWLGCQWLKLATSPLDRNNSTSGRQLPRRSMRLPWDRDTSQSGIYSEDSDIDSASMVSVATSSTSTCGEQWTRETFDRHINWKVALHKLNNDSSTNDQWIWLADICRYINFGCSMNILENVIDKSLSNGFGGVWFRMNRVLGDTVEGALDKMMMTNQHQHSDWLLQEFYTMTQRTNDPIGKYANATWPGSWQSAPAVHRSFG